MGRLILFLLLIVFTNNRLSAQESKAGSNSTSEKKAVPDSSKVRVTFKKQSSLAAEKNTFPKKSNQVAGNSHKNSATSGNGENTSKTLETIRIDYNNMPHDVQLKINSNKAAGKGLLEGIAKMFTVEIKTCTSDADHKKILSFLKTKKGFINSQFVSPGLVKIIVEPSFDSVDLKGAMVAEGISFNFLTRSYLLKK